MAGKDRVHSVGASFVTQLKVQVRALPRRELQLSALRAHSRLLKAASMGMPVWQLQRTHKRTDERSIIVGLGQRTRKQTCQQSRQQLTTRSRTRVSGRRGCRCFLCCSIRTDSSLTGPLRFLARSSVPTTSVHRPAAVVPGLTNQIKSSRFERPRSAPAFLGRHNFT